MKYMEGIFDKMAPAEKVVLAARLPKEGMEEEESEEEEEEDEEDEVMEDGQENAVVKGGENKGSETMIVEEDVRSYYEAPNSIVPMAA